MEGDMRELNWNLPKKKDTKVLKKVSEVRASTKGGYYFINFGLRHNFYTQFEAMVKRDELAKYKGLEMLYFPMKVTIPNPEIIKDKSLQQYYDKMYDKKVMSKL